MEAEPASGQSVQRYYDPLIGQRFLSVDPVTAYSNPIDAFNRYWYANENPYKFTDPDGRSVLTKLVKLAIKGGDIAATVGGIVDDVNTLRSSTSTAGEKILAGVSLLSEVVSPVSIGDAKDVAKAVSKGIDAVGVGKKSGKATGVIYRVPGSATPSGKPYIGRADDLELRAKKANDGRDRSQAEVVGTYLKGDTQAGRVAEQQAINANGGVANLDNKRNEIAPSKWKDKGVE